MRGSFAQSSGEELLPPRSQLQPTGLRPPPLTHLRPGLPKDLDQLVVLVPGRECLKVILQEHETDHVLQRLHLRVSLEAPLPEELAHAPELREGYQAVLARGLAPMRVLAELTLYDLLGQRVRILFSDWLTAGPHAVRWDGRDEAGKGVATGVYLYRLEAAEKVAARKLLFLR